MSSDSEIDDLQRFEESRQRELSARAGLGRNQFQDEEVSDEEVLGIESEDDLSEEGDDQEAYYGQDDEAVKEKRSRTDREQDENWGNTRDNYFGGEDDIGAEEGASDEEEEEALRLHQKELEEMAESDFVDEDNLDGWKKESDNLELQAPQESIIAVDPSSMSKDERRELIEEKFPAVALLTNELIKCDQWNTDLETDSNLSSQAQEIGKSALNTYKGMIYSFFALFTDKLQKADFSGLSRLDEHPVNEGLLMSRELWYNFLKIDWNTASSAEAFSKSKPVPVDSGESVSEDEADEREETKSLRRSQDEDEDTDLSDFDSFEEDNEAYKSGHPGTESNSESEDEFSIARPDAVKPKRTRGVVGDFDETADTIEQQARAKNKQSLRFYTSQIGKGEQQKHDAYSGDVDLPYREREFERRQRLMAEAQKRGQQQRDKLGEEDDFEGDSLAEGAASSAGDAYSALKAQRHAAKAEKTQRHAEASEAARQGRIAEYLAENPNVDKRAINYQIEKNKGLTRKRKKENRNARVKKRVRYESAQKKLKGVRQVYKGQEGPYQGELTGIRKNLTHSTRFKN